MPKQSAGPEEATEKKRALLGFAITSHRGFHMKFANGWTISVQFGPGNYCMNYNTIMEPDGYDAPRKDSYWQSEDAEIAAWDSGGNWHRFDGDTVKGRVSPDEVLGFMNKVAAFAPAERPHASR